MHPGRLSTHPPAQTHPDPPGKCPLPACPALRQSSTSRPPPSSAGGVLVLAGGEAEEQREYGALFRAVPCRAVPCRAVPCRAVPCRAMPCLPAWLGVPAPVLVPLKVTTPPPTHPPHLRRRLAGRQVRDEFGVTLFHLRGEWAGGSTDGWRDVVAAGAPERGKLTIEAWRAGSPLPPLVCLCPPW